MAEVPLVTSVLLLPLCIQGVAFGLLPDWSPTWPSTGMGPLPPTCHRSWGCSLWAGLGAGGGAVSLGSLCWGPYSHRPGKLWGRCMGWVPSCRASHKPQRLLSPHWWLQTTPGACWTLFRGTVHNGLYILGCLWEDTQDWESEVRIRD